MAESKPPVIHPPEVSESDMPLVYEWVDQFTLSRPKRNIARDFSDGVLVAEILHTVYPRLVDLHNYSPQNGAQGRAYNWATLNSEIHLEKVFEKMGFTIARRSVEEVVNCVPGAIEKVLSLIHVKVRVTQIEEWEQAGKTPIADASSSSTPKNGFARLMLRPGQDFQVPQQSALLHKEEVIQELKETIEILENKLRKSDQLLKMKDARIEELTAQIQSLIGQ